MVTGPQQHPSAGPPPIPARCSRPTAESPTLGRTDPQHSAKRKKRTGRSLLPQHQLSAQRPAGSGWEAPLPRDLCTNPAAAPAPVSPSFQPPTLPSMSLPLSGKMASALPSLPLHGAHPPRLAGAGLPRRSQTAAILLVGWSAGRARRALSVHFTKALCALEASGGGLGAAGGWRGRVGWGGTARGVRRAAPNTGGRIDSEARSLGHRTRPLPPPQHPAGGRHYSQLRPLVANLKERGKFSSRSARRTAWRRSGGGVGGLSGPASGLCGAPSDCRGLRWQRSFPQSVRELRSFPSAPIPVLLQGTARGNGSALCGPGGPLGAAAPPTTSPPRSARPQPLRRSEGGEAAAGVSFDAHQGLSEPPSVRKRGAPDKSGAGSRSPASMEPPHAGDWRSH